MYIYHCVILEYSCLSVSFQAAGRIKIFDNRTPFIFLEIPELPHLGVYTLNIPLIGPNCTTWNLIHLQREIKIEKSELQAKF